MENGKEEIKAALGSVLLEGSEARPEMTNPLPPRCLALRRFCRQSGLRQREIAARLNVSEQALSRWLSGRVSPSNVWWRLICQMFPEVNK